MSRLFGLFFVMCDAMMTAASFLTSSGVLVVAALSVLTSLIMAGTSAAIRSVLWPTYFWDQPEQLQAAPPSGLVAEVVQPAHRSGREFRY